MKLDDIMNEWEKDSHINEAELGAESIKTPYLHHKYFKMYTGEGMLLKKLEYERKSLYRDKYQYYIGILDEETMRQHGWEPNPLKILKADLPIYLESDEDLQLVDQRIDIQKQKLSFLESVIKTLSNRGFMIKNAIDWAKFMNGQ